MEVYTSAVWQRNKTGYGENTKNIFISCQVSSYQEIYETILSSPWSAALSYIYGNQDCNSCELFPSYQGDIYAETQGPEKIFQFLWIGKIWLYLRCGIINETKDYTGLHNHKLRLPAY